MYDDKTKQIAINGYKILKKEGYKGEKLKDIFTKLYEIPTRTLYSWLRKEENNKKKNKNTKIIENITTINNLNNNYDSLKITKEIETEVLKLHAQKITNIKKIIKNVFKTTKIKIEKKHILYIYKTNGLERNNKELKKKIDICIIETVNNNKTITAKQLTNVIHEKFSNAKNTINRSKTYVYNILEAHGFSYKNTKINNNPNPLEEQKRQALIIKEILDNCKDKVIVSLDEMGIHNFEQCKKGWSLKGTECIINVDKAKIKNEKFSLLKATSKEKIINYTIVEKSMKTDKFINFITKLDRLDKEKKNVYFMDNATIHKSKKFKELIEKLNLKVVYNIPYHSEFNPIEMVFSLLRKEIQKGVNKTKDDIASIITTFMKDINKNKSETLKKIFEHAFKNLDNFTK